MTIKTTNETWYMLLGLGIPNGFAGFSSKKHFVKINSYLRKINVRLRRLGIKTPMRSCVDNLDKYVFSFSGDQVEDDENALKLAESFLYSLTLFHGPVLPFDEETLIYKFPPGLITKANFNFTLSGLAKLEESKIPEERTLQHPANVFGTAYSTSPERTEEAWKITDLIFTNQSFFEAARFYQRSTSLFYVYPGEIDDIDPTHAPSASLTKSRYEDALLNAYKAVEATVGVPSKNAKFINELNALGLSPDDEVGYFEKTTLGKVLAEMQDARNKKAGHGRTDDKKREIKTSRLLNYQECAKLLIISSIMKREERCNASDK